MKTSFIAAAAAVIVAAAVGFAAGQSTESGLHRMKLPLELPAVGNIDAVKNWRFARVEQIERSTGPDIRLRLRLADGRTVQVVGPSEQLSALGRACGWVTTETQTVAGRSDYVERLIAFDADETGRIIAVISMEPFNRDRTRLRRVLCR